MPSLLEIGSFGLSVIHDYEEVNHYLGSGHSLTISTGHSLGTRSYKLIYNILPDAAGQLIANPETGTNQTRAHFVWWFWNKRKQDRMPFDVYDPFDETNVSCVFVDKEISFENLAAKLWSSNLRIRQYRPL